MTKWKRVKIPRTNNTRWYPSGTSKSGRTRYIYSIQTQGGRGDVWKYKRKHWKDHPNIDRSVLWVALKKAWIAFYIRLRYQEWEELEFYSHVIQHFEEKLGLDIKHFPIQDPDVDQERYTAMHKFLNRKD
jgi:hypothetical protein